jgi:hypothetical protein
VAPAFLEYRPKQPWVEIVSVTGDRVAGSRLAIKAKMFGFKPAQIWRQPVSAEFSDRVNGAATRTRVTGDTPGSQNGYVYFDEDGEATIHTTALAAGNHRLSVYLPYYSLGYDGIYTDELPVAIAPAGSPAPPVPELERPSVSLVLSGPGRKITNQPLTLTAHVSDPSLAGTVQFMNANGDAIGAPVGVVGGVAAHTAVVPNAIAQFFARFDPAADPLTTISPVSPSVPIVRAMTELPYPPATTTTTALEVTGDRVVGAPLSATVTVSAASTTDPLASRDVNGYVEVLDGDKVVGFARTRLAQATIDLSALGAGAHSLSARYVPSDAVRSTGSASPAQAVTVIAKTDAPAPVGGTVPATLSLTLGAPASFGAFTPGVTKDYSASTTATVLSTAGDAALTVSDPGRLTNGAFALASPLEVSFAKSAWTAPVTNETVAIGFKQHVDSTDALRTGTYSRTLTFTLSTTTP